MPFGLPDSLSKEFLFINNKVLVMSYQQFIVSVVKLIMLSWQQILFNFCNMSVNWLFYKIEVHILHGLKFKISSFYIWKL